MYANKNNYIPLWHKYSLSVEEASQLFGVGENKIRQIVADNPNAEFYFEIGNRIKIKRTKFEEYLDKVTSI